MSFKCAVLCALLSLLSAEHGVAHEIFEQSSGLAHEPVHKCGDNGTCDLPHHDVGPASEEHTASDHSGHSSEEPVEHEWTEEEKNELLKSLSATFESYDFDADTVNMILQQLQSFKSQDPEGFSYMDSDDAVDETLMFDEDTQQPPSSASEEPLIEKITFTDSLQSFMRDLRAAARAPGIYDKARATVKVLFGAVTGLWAPARRHTARYGSIAIRKARDVSLVAMSSVRAHTAVAVRRAYDLAVPQTQMLTKYVLHLFRRLYSKDAEHEEL